MAERTPGHPDGDDREGEETVAPTPRAATPPAAAPARATPVEYFLGGLVVLAIIVAVLLATGPMG